MIVVCISGKAQSGKDTFAEITKKNLCELGRRVLIAHNADLLKYMCKQLFGWDGKKDEHGRHMLQYVGTDIVRNKRPDFWVNFIIEVLNIFHDEWDYVLIPDCRFPNEIDRFAESGYPFIHVRIERIGHDNGLSSEQKQHESETALDKVKPDITIANNSSMDNLAKEVKLLIDRLENRYGNFDKKT